MSFLELPCLLVNNTKEWGLWKRHCFEIFRSRTSSQCCTRSPIWSLLNNQDTAVWVELGHIISFTIKVYLIDDIGTKVKTQNFNFTKDVSQMLAYTNNSLFFLFSSVCFLMSASFIQNYLFQLNLFHTYRETRKSNAHVTRFRFLFYSSSSFMTGVFYSKITYTNYSRHRVYLFIILELIF